MIKYLSKIITFNKLNVIGIVKKDDTEYFNLLSIAKKGSKLSMLASRKFDSFERLSSSIDNKIPVLLVLDGKGVLNKKVDTENDADTSWLKTIDFNTIYHTTHQEEQLSFMSFCRETLVQENIALFAKANFEVLDLYIGSFIGLVLKDFVNTSNYISGELHLSFNEEASISFSKSESKNPTYAIGSDDIMSSHLPLYASAIS